MKLLTMAIMAALGSTTVYAEQVVDVQKSKSVETSIAKNTDLKTSYEIVQRAKSIVARVEQSGANDYLSMCQLINNPSDTFDNIPMRDGQRHLIFSFPFSQQAAGVASKYFNYGGYATQLAKESGVNRITMPVYFKSIALNDAIAGAKGGLNPGLYSWIGWKSTNDAFFYVVRQTGASPKEVAGMLIRDETAPFVTPEYKLIGNSTWSVIESDFDDDFLIDMTGIDGFVMGSSYRLVNPKILKSCVIVTAEAVHTAATAISVGKSEEQALQEVANREYFDLPGSTFGRCTVPTLLALQKGQTAQMGMRCNDGFVFDPTKQEAYYKGVPWLSDAVVKGDKFSYETSSNTSNTKKSSNSTNSNKKTIQ